MIYINSDGQRIKTITKQEVARFGELAIIDFKCSCGGSKGFDVIIYNGVVHVACRKCEKPCVQFELI